MSYSFIYKADAIGYYKSLQSAHKIINSVYFPLYAIQLNNLLGQYDGFLVRSSCLPHAH